MPVRVLPEAVIDQIAAGEVLERPAHLVKELVENSLDAGSMEIEIEFDDGGRRVRVQDNGQGMNADDLKLATRRFATSKIHSSEDLFSLASYGFRGEALASVAAVSRLTITTRTSAAATGLVFRSQYGEAQPLTETDASFGTSILVEELFENVPARLKFLKSEAAESGQIKQVLKAMALARPDVQFRVRAKGELAFFWPARKKWQERVADVLGLDSMFEASEARDGIQVQALLAPPDQTLQQNRGIWLFVQDRWVQDRALAAAVMESYRTLLMHGEYPQVVLKLHVPKDFVDVNVHPSKSQVKFQDGQKVFRLVVHALRSRLETAPWLKRRPQPDVEVNKPVSERFFDAAFSTVQYQKKEFPVAEVRELVAEYRREEAHPKPAGHWGQMEVIGQANLTYIVAQSESDFYLIDQHAAHERVVFERLMEQWTRGKFDIQTLLLPLVVDLSAAEMEAMESSIPGLASLGLTVEKIGPEALAISAIPSFISETSAVRAVRDLAHEIALNGGSFAWEKKAGDVFATMACHSVIRAGQTMSVSEMKSLLAQMDEFPLSTFCPHGRPVSVTWSFADLEKKFGRIV